MKPEKTRRKQRSVRTEPQEDKQGLQGQRKETVQTDTVIDKRKETGGMDRKQRSSLFEKKKDVYKPSHLSVYLL